MITEISCFKKTFAKYFSLAKGKAGGTKMKERLIFNKLPLCITACASKLLLSNESHLGRLDLMKFHFHLL